MEQLQSMGLALVIFIAAYLKMSTPEILPDTAALFCFVLSSPATVALYTEEIGLKKCLKQNQVFLTVFGNFRDRCMYLLPYAVFPRSTADEFLKSNIAK